MKGKESQSQGYIKYVLPSFLVLSCFAFFGGRLISLFLVKTALMNTALGGSP